jgi:hypothetical protein
MLARLINWYASTANPIIAGTRSFVRRHSALRSWGRATIRLALDPRTELARWRHPPVDERLRAIMDARQVGGALTVTELARLWDAGKRSRRALCLGDDPELEQIEIVLRAASPVIETARSGKIGSDTESFDLVVKVGGAQRAGVAAGSRALLVEASGSRRASHFGLPASTKHWTQGPLVGKLARGDPLHVVILNDAGFQYGAGIAMRRQAASFLLNGWTVSLVSFAGEASAAPAITGVRHLARRFSAYCVPEAADLVPRIQSLQPDLLLVGTIHGSGWPISVLSRLREAGIAVAAYMHDCHFVTGRCVHMGACSKFISGCDAQCPTAEEPPRLERDKIAPAWRERAALFSGPAAIPLIANSSWTRATALQRFADAGRIDLVHLGLDHDLFAPMPKSLARELLALPQDKIIVTMGAFDVRDRWKGGPLFQAVHKAMLDRDDVAVTLVGGSSERLASARSFGRIADERQMPFVLNAADLFINTAIEETFGQMLLEASACAVPVVSLDVGGVGDIVAREEGGVLIRQKTAADLLAGVERLIRDRSLRERMGRHARARVEQHFTLAHQAGAWIACLQRLFA